MTIGDQDHGRVSMSVAAALAGMVHQLFYLASGQVFSNCTIYSAWTFSTGCLIWHEKFLPVTNDWEDNTLFLYSYQQARRIPAVYVCGISDLLRTAQSSMRRGLAYSIRCGPAL